MKLGGVGVGLGVMAGGSERRRSSGGRNDGEFPYESGEMDHRLLLLQGAAAAAEFLAAAVGSPDALSRDGSEEETRPPCTHAETDQNFR